MMQVFVCVCIMHKAQLSTLIYQIFYCNFSTCSEPLESYSPISSPDRAESRRYKKMANLPVILNFSVFKKQSHWLPQSKLWEPNPKWTESDAMKNVRQYLTQVSIRTVLHGKQRKWTGSNLYDIRWDCECSDDVWMM